MECNKAGLKKGYENVLWICLLHLKDKYAVLWEKQNVNKRLCLHENTG